MRLKTATLFLFAIFVLVPQMAYAVVVAQSRVEGKVVDSQNINVPNSSVSFEDSTNKPVVSGTTSQDGSYLIVVPQGTYTVVVKAPQSVNAPEIIHKGQIISGNTSLNFTLNIPLPKVAPEVPKKTTPLNLIVVVLSLIAIGTATGFYLMKNKKNDNVPPQAPTGTS